MGLPIRVLLVDDHTMFREGVRIRLDLESDFEVVGEAETAGQALALVGELEPEVVILDIRLPDLSGIELTRQIRGKWPDVKILVLSGYDFDQYVRALARLGIQGYLLKLSAQDTLVQAIRRDSGWRSGVTPKHRFKGNAGLFVGNFQASGPGTLGIDREGTGDS